MAIFKRKYLKNLWLVRGNDKSKAVWKCKNQDILEEMVRKDAILEYQCLEVIVINEKEWKGETR